MNKSSFSLEKPVLENPAGEFYEFSFEAIGTDCRLMFSSEQSAKANTFTQDVERWMKDFESRYSRYQPDSIISRINACAGISPVKIDNELARIFSLCDWFYWRTGNIFDPSALPLINIWDYQNEKPCMPDEGQISNALSNVGWSTVIKENNTVYLPRKGMCIDIGGIGKEYAVDRIMEMAIERGFRNVLIDFGHDVRVLGAPPEGGAWRIGLEDWTDTGKCALGVATSDRAIATSGDYQRGFTVDGVNYGHILDTRTGRPVSNGCRSVSVIAPTCTEAGIVATTVFILGPDEGLSLLNTSYQVEGCIWTETSEIRSKGFDHYVI